MCLCTIFRTELLKVGKNHVESILKCKTEQRSSLDLGYLVTDSITTNYKRFYHIISKTIPIEKRRNHFEVNSRRCTTTSAIAAAMTTSLPIHASLYIFYAVPNYNSLSLSVAVCCIFKQCLIKQTNKRILALNSSGHHSDALEPLFLSSIRSPLISKTKQISYHFFKLFFIRISK